MKILASTGSTKLMSTGLDQYVGKDIWIKCRRYSVRDYWVRILHKQGEDGDRFVFYTVNFISESALDSLLDPPSWSAYRIKDPNHLPLDTERVSAVEIVLPLTTKSTQELFNLSDYAVDSETANVMEQFAGTNLWLLATDTNHHNDYYININKKTGDVIEFDCADAWVVDDPTSWDIESGPPSEAIGVMEYDRISHIDSWDVKLPPVLLTTTEVDDAIDEAEKYFWDNYEEDDYYDDEDEE